MNCIKTIAIAILISLQTSCETQVIESSIDTQSTEDAIFTIKTQAFQAREKSECRTHVDIIGIKGNTLRVGGSNASIAFGKNEFILFCYGAKHAWRGRISYAGYIFDSSRDSPLEFEVTKDNGYVYIKGEGTVTGPDGKTIRLP